MKDPAEIIPGVIFYSCLTEKRKEKVCFFDHNTLVLQMAGQFILETTSQKISINEGEMLLIRKNQLVELTKVPPDGKHNQTIVLRLQEELLRKIALEEKIDQVERYQGDPNILIPDNDFLRGFFNSIVPYVNHSEEQLNKTLGILKVKEAVQLLIYTKPELKEALFDFSEPHKIDLEKFMLSNYHFNIPVEKFARLTGRSLAGFKRDFQKIFKWPPRHWLLDKRLMEAKYLMEKKKIKPSVIYLDLGFESLSHFSHSFKKKYGKSPSEWLN